MAAPLLLNACVADPHTSALIDVVRCCNDCASELFRVDTKLSLPHARQVFEKWSAEHSPQTYATAELVGDTLDNLGVVDTSLNERARDALIRHLQNTQASIGVSILRRGNSSSSAVHKQLNDQITALAARVQQLEFAMKRAQLAVPAPPPSYDDAMRARRQQQRPQKPLPPRPMATPKAPMPPPRPADDPLDKPQPPRGPPPPPPPRTPASGGALTLSNALASRPPLKPTSTQPTRQASGGILEGLQQSAARRRAAIADDEEEPVDPTWTEQDIQWHIASLLSMGSDLVALAME